MTALTLQQRRDLVAVPVTLDGEPAVITGAQNEFATIATLRGGRAAPWSWPAAERVVQAGGHFRT